MTKVGGIRSYHPFENALTAKIVVERSLHVTQRGAHICDPAQLQGQIVLVRDACRVRTGKPIGNLCCAGVVVERSAGVAVSSPNTSHLVQGGGQLALIELVVGVGCDQPLDDA